MQATTAQSAATGFPHFSGGFCDDRHCAGSSAHTYDGHWVWRTAADYARDHHADGTECTNPLGCDNDDCHKVAREVPARGLSVLVNVKVPGRAGYDPTPPGTDVVNDYCGGCRLFWPADLVTYDAGPDDWFCPQCR